MGKKRQPDIFEYSERHIRRLKRAKVDSMIAEIESEVNSNLQRLERIQSVKNDSITERVDGSCFKQLTHFHNEENLTSENDPDFSGSNDRYSKDYQFTSEEKNYNDYIAFVSANPSEYIDQNDESDCPALASPNSLKHFDTTENLAAEDLNDFDTLLDFLKSNEQYDIEVTDNEDDVEISDMQKMYEKNNKFVQEIAEICAEHNNSVPKYVVEKILGVLRRHTDAPFPKTYNALVGTPRKVEVVNMDNGQYVHLSLKATIEHFVSTYKENNIDCQDLKLLLNVDGAPLAKSSDRGLWIISVSEQIMSLVSLVGVYHGPDKPTDSSELMKKTVEELTQLINEGIVIEDKKISISLRALTCDLPARAYVLKTKYHNGFWSCLKCHIKAESINKRRCFIGEAAPRNDSDFRDYAYADDDITEGLQQIHKQGVTNITEIPKFNIIKDTTFDYLHLVLLGIMLKLLDLWTSLLPTLSTSDRNRISARSRTISNFTPEEFERKPKKFEQSKRWKGHELRQFLLYVGPVVLLGILEDSLYNHFLKFHVAILILVNPILCYNEFYLNLAERLLKEFVTDFPRLYQAQYVNHNMHCLLH